MESKTKLVTAPLSISDMDEDLESSTVYIFDYTKSTLKGVEFLNYIKNCGLIADVYFDQNVNYETKSELLIEYMKSSSFYHLTSFNSTILNVIYSLSNTNKRIKFGFFNESELNKIKSSHYDLFNIWKQMYDSLFYYMMNMIHLGKENITNKEKIKCKYNTFCDDTSVSPNIFSVLLDPFFYDYYGIIELQNNDTYYTYYFDNNLYDEKSLPLLLLNDSNYILKILYDTLYDPRFKEYLETKTDLILN